MIQSTSLKKITFYFKIMLLLLLSHVSLAQRFSANTKKFIAIDTTIVAIKNVSLIDGTGNSLKPNQTIVFNKGIITQIGNSDDITFPKNTLVIDGSNKTVMPGLVMTHEHMYISSGAIDHSFLNVSQLSESFPRLYLASGATTIRTCGSIQPFSDLRIKKDIDDGISPGPDIDLTSPYLGGKNAMFPAMKELQSPEEATEFVDFWANQGFTSFKAYMGIDKPTLKAAIEEAHKRGLKITGHLCAVTYREAAELGIDHLEHGFFASTDFDQDKIENQCNVNSAVSIANIDPKSDAVKNLIQFLIDKKVGITSTLAVLEGFTTTQPVPANDILNAMAPENRDYYLKQLIRIKSMKSPSLYDKTFQKNAQMEKLFHDMGGLLTVGTDPTGNGGTLAGYGTWRTIELLVEADGFTPLEAIKIATLNGAKELDLEDKIGILEIGKTANLLLIDGDPSKNISAIRKVIYVFKNGVGYNSKKLFESVKGKVGIN